jgi:hypothetical protein
LTFYLTPLSKLIELSLWGIIEKKEILGYYGLQRSAETSILVQENLSTSLEEQSI